MIQLRALEPEDLELLYTIENDPTLWSLGTPSAPYSRYALKQYVAQQADFFTAGTQRLVISLNDKGIGLIDLFNYSPADARAEVGIALLAAHRGQGHAAEALRQLAAHALNHLHLHQLYALVPANNAPSRQLFLRCGFSPVALLPQWHYADAAYHDVQVWQKLL